MLLRMKINQCVLLLEFIIDYVQGNELTLCKKIQTENFPNSPYMKKIIYIDDELTILPTNNIKRNCVHMNIGNERFISVVPNWYSY